jgi:dienelactone hydrolase
MTDAGSNSRGRLDWATVTVLVLVLAACDGGGTDADGALARPPVADDCGATAVLEGGECREFAVRIDARATTAFVEDGQPVELEIVLFKPPGEARYPVLMFNHGSTGNGSDPTLFGETFISKSISRFFVERGWMVAYPQRRGRGRSDGLYDEGFKPDRSGYSCVQGPALAGAERALEDLEAATEWLRSRADVDTTRMLVGGTSRGGVLSVVLAARRPEVFRGALNFVGGWLGEGCGDHASVNRSLFVSAAPFQGPSLWLYGANDSFYSLEYSRSQHAAYVQAGGLGSFHQFTRAPGLNGHFLINDPALWTDVVDEFLDGLQ